MILINENRLRQIIREAVTVAAGEDELKSIGDDIQKGLAIAKKMAGGKPMGFVRDAGDLYVYAAIGGDLTVGPAYDPEMFVVIHDGARPDKKSLGAVFKPDDLPPNANQFFPDTTGSDASQQAATDLVAEYRGMNSYDFLVRNVRAGVIPAGPPAEVAAAPLVPEGTVAPAAAASDMPAAVAVAKKPSLLSKLFKRKGERKQPAGTSARQPQTGAHKKQPAVEMPAEPGVRAKAIAFRIFNQVSAGSGIQAGGEKGGVLFTTFSGQIKDKINSLASKKAIAWFSKKPTEVLPDRLLADMNQGSILKFLEENDILDDEEITEIYQMILEADSATQKIKARNAAFDQRMKDARASYRQ